MAIQYNGNTMGIITIDQKGNEFELQIRQGNCLAVIIHSNKEQDGTFTHTLMQFFSDEEHLKRICEIVDDCEKKECWCEKCQEHQRYECVETT